LSQIDCFHLLPGGLIAPLNFRCFSDIHGLTSPLGFRPVFFRLRQIELGLGLLRNILQTDVIP
jgi:hypothetical protein